MKVYKKMIDEWQQFSLAERVKQVNLANPREPVAVVEDSGQQDLDHACTRFVGQESKDRDSRHSPEKGQRSRPSIWKARRP